MPRVLNIIYSLTLGGAARTTIATAKYSSQTGPFEHSIAVLDLLNTDPQAIEHAMAEGLSVPIVKNRDDLRREISAADIVQVNWWQHPAMEEFLRSDLPEARLLIWFHCSGDRPPQVVTPELVDVADMAVAGSLYTYEGYGFQTLSPSDRLKRTRMVNGGCDPLRVASATPRTHDRFTVTYIGTVDYIKMHEEFLRMSALATVPNLRVLVCGGPLQRSLQKAAQEMGYGERFEFRGYEKNIATVLSETDVFGYPLTPDTYAASELTLQEAMFCGIPAVVFPHGGLKRLVIDHYNGLVVRSSEEYAAAIEYLYQNPEERLRMGKNAAHLARELFGAERWAPHMNSVYAELLERPKTKRRWGEGRRSVQPLVPVDHPRYSAAEIFIETLGGLAPQFERSYLGRNLSDLLEAEHTIAYGTELMRRAGIWPFQSYYPADPFLKLWTGLAYIGAGRDDEALNYLAGILGEDLGPSSLRILCYVAYSSIRCGAEEPAQHARQTLLNAHPTLLSFCDSLIQAAREGREWSSTLPPPRESPRV